MKLTGTLKNPDVYTYYVTGSLEEKVENLPLQKMLKKIKDGGMNTFLNDNELKKFAQGLKYSFEKDGYINKNNSLTATGEDIVETGKSWNSLQGAFLFTVLRFGRKAYLLNAELVKDSDGFIGGDRPKSKFNDDEYAGWFRNIKTDENWGDWKKQPQNVSVEFCFDYGKAECGVTVKFDNETVSFTTTETSDFSIIKRATAMHLLEESENKEGVFVFSVKDTTAVRICVSDAEKLSGKEWLKTFFEKGSFYLPTKDDDFADMKIEDICLYIGKDDAKTAEVLLSEYLLRKAEISYLGYEETGRFVSEFQNLFVSPDGTYPSCPGIMKETPQIYNGLVERAKSVAQKNPTAYLHLQAFIDLLPENTLKPYIEKECVKNLSNREISFEELVTEVFGNERNIKSISAFSKYTVSNGKNARAFILFAESVAKHFGIQTTLITTDEVKQNVGKYKETDEKWFEKMETQKDMVLIKRKHDEIKNIHDRYYKVVRENGSVEWWVMTGELDSLRFDNDNPRIREDIQITEKGTVKEMTFSKIKQEGVPESVKTIMEVN